MIEFGFVRPETPENIGAAARAMKTMGFSRMIIVDSSAHRAPASGWMAHGSAEILADAVESASLAAAIEGAALVIGTSARSRAMTRVILTPDELLPLLAARGADERICLVFGPESTGLSNEELARCDVLTRVSAAVEYPSLNLAQAVMVYAYAYALSSCATSHGLASDAIDADAAAHLKTRVSAALDALGFSPDEALRLRVMERVALLNEKDARIVHAIARRIESTGGGCE
jgi:tRNA/rRNA methyltransferase